MSAAGTRAPDKGQMAYDETFLLEQFTLVLASRGASAWVGARSAHKTPRRMSLRPRTARTWRGRCRAWRWQRSRLGSRVAYDPRDAS